MAEIKIEDIQEFWENNPVSAAAIPFEPGTPEFFERHRKMRMEFESQDFLKAVYEWDQHTGERLLDIGCGTGFVVELYAKGGAKVFGIDIANRSVELTQKRVQILGLRADIRQANAEDLPFDDNYFDIVTSYGVLHHTPNTHIAIQEVFRVLKPGGKAILMFYNRNSFAYQLLFRIKRWVQPNWRGKTAQDQVSAVDGPENPLGKVYSKGDLSDLLSDFRRLDFQTNRLFFHWQRFLPGPILSFLSRNWGWHLFVKAYKPVDQ